MEKKELIKRMVKDDEERLEQHRKIKRQELIDSGVLKIEKKGLVDSYLGDLTQGDLEKLDNIKLIMGRVFEDIKGILHEYMDMREDYYDLMALWIIGTYIHDSFETFPYLFINAMRGSGKSRAMK